MSDVDNMARWDFDGFCQIEVIFNHNALALGSQIDSVKNWLQRYDGGVVISVQNTLSPQCQSCKTPTKLQSSSGALRSRIWCQLLGFSTEKKRLPLAQVQIIPCAMDVTLCFQSWPATATYTGVVFELFPSKYIHGSSMGLWELGWM